MGQTQSDSNDADGPSLIEIFIVDVLRGFAHETEAIRKQLRDWIRLSNSVNILVTGKTGAGKSTLVNALIGKKVAREGEDINPMTDQVTCYATTVSGIEIRVWDSPGLQDGTGNEAAYVANMKAKCKDIDLCVICINVSTARFTKDAAEVKALEKLTSAFGQSLWDHALVALTYANELERRNEMRLAKRHEDMDKLSKLFQGKIAEWDKCLRAMLINTIKLDPNRVENLKMIPTGFENASLPDRGYWLSTFWFSTLRSMHHRAQPAMVFINHARIVETPETVKDAGGQQFLEDQKLIFSERGFEVGKEIGNADLGQHIGEHVAVEFAEGLLARVVMGGFMKFLESLREHLEHDSDEDSDHCE